MLRVRRYRPCLAFRCPWSGALAAVHPAPVGAPNGGVLAERVSTGFSQASRARPIRSKTRCHAGFDKFCVVNFIHYLFPPLMGLGVRPLFLVAV